MRALKTAGLFAGIGGIELGLHRSGHETVLLCEADDGARAVLRKRFRGVPLESDVREMRTLPTGVELLAAGLPGWGIAPAGVTPGLDGSHAGLIDEVFRLLRRRRVPWVLLEHAPSLLRLDRGQVMEAVASTFEAFGYAWTYRIVDTWSFGLPQRRKRVFFLATTAGDPRRVLLADDAGEPPELDHRGRACGFYWAEEAGGPSWTVDAVPTLKGGSHVGISSPPAIWMPDGAIVTPGIRDAERLQGFAVDWTAPVADVARPTLRWKLVGNAVSVPVAEWIGRRLIQPGALAAEAGPEMDRDSPWPGAAAAVDGVRRAYSASPFPVVVRPAALRGFLQFPTPPLSARAAAAFSSRLLASGFEGPPEFLVALQEHIEAQGEGAWCAGEPEFTGAR